MAACRPRRVIVVRLPETQPVEQVVFLLRQDAPEPPDARVLRRACRAAEAYVCGGVKTPRSRSLRGVLMLLLGAAVTALAWAVSARIR